MIRAIQVRRTAHRGERAKHLWEGAASWYRIRYDDGAAVAQVLTYLSRAVGPLALRRRVDGAVSALFVGIDAERSASLESRQPQGYLLEPVSAPAARSPRAVYAPADRLPLGTRDAWVAAGTLWLSGDVGVPFPPGTHSAEPGAWDLPNPPLGEALNPAWPGNPPHPPREPNGFVVGVASGDPQPLSVTGCQIVGDAAHMTSWLSHFVAANAAMSIIDCSGRLAPRLVTSYNAFDVSLHQPDRFGFNPLAPLSDAAQTEARNAWWWRDMHLPPPCHTWLARQPDLTSWAALQGRAQRGGAVGQLLCTVLDSLFTHAERTLLSGTAVPWSAPARLVAHLPGKSAGVRHIVRALAASLLHSDHAVLLVQPPLTPADWRALGSRNVAAVTTHPLPCTPVVALRCRPAQIPHMRTRLRPAPCEALISLSAREALVSRSGDAWRVAWP